MFMKKQLMIYCACYPFFFRKLKHPHTLGVSDCVCFFGPRSLGDRLLQLQVRLADLHIVSLKKFATLQGVTFFISKTWMFPKIMVPPNHPILIGFSIINHPFRGTPIFGNTHMKKTLNLSKKRIHYPSLRKIIDSSGGYVMWSFPGG